MFSDKIYAEYIESLAYSGENKTFYNSNEDHAAIVLSTIIKYAKKEAVIYCTDLCSNVSQSEEYISAVRDFLERNGTLKIILTDPQPEELESTELFQVFRDYRKQIVIKTSDDYIRYSDKIVNFTVADGKSFRFETDILKKKAIGNFNNPTEASILIGKFNDKFTADNARDFWIAPPEAVSTFE